MVYVYTFHFVLGFLFEAVDNRVVVDFINAVSNHSFTESQCFT